MWWILAIVITLVLEFYWFAFCGTVMAWLFFITSLVMGRFILAGFWFATGSWFMFFWWHDDPQFASMDLSVGEFTKYALTWMAIGAIPVGIKYLYRYSKKQTEPTEEELPQIPMPEVSFEVAPDPVPVKRRRARKTINLVERDGVFVPANGEW